MSKVKIIDRRSEFSIFNEKELLSKMNHPFIVNMYFSFQDFSNLYLVLDYLTGGDLRYHISIHQRFNEKETKFFISNIILGLEYIHSKNIIHRDIKPENLVLDNKGYLRISDFGVAKINLKDNSSETSGTPGYMAPEVLFILNHSFPADFFALGVIGFEFMMGFRPYNGRNRKEIKDVILNTQAKINMNKVPYGWGKDSVDFINRLLERKVKNRLGAKKGICELKEHKWFNDVNWDELKLKKIKAPFVPKGEENFNRNYCEGVDPISNETIERYREYMNDDNYNILFNNYTFSNIENLKLIAENNNKNKFNDNIDKMKTYNKDNINNNIFDNNENSKECNKEENKILKKSNGLTNILSLSSTNFLIKSNRKNINNHIDKIDILNNKKNKRNNIKNVSENKKNQNSETISIKSLNINNNNNTITSKKNNTINIENNSSKTNNISEEIKVPSSNKLINRTFSLNDVNNNNNKNKTKTFDLEKKQNKLKNNFSINNINYFIGEEYKKFNNNYNNNNNKIKLILTKSNSMKIIDENLEKIFLKKKLFKNENSNLKLFQNIENNINSNQRIFQSILNNNNNKKFNHKTKKNYFISNREKTFFNNSNITNETFQNKNILMSNNNNNNNNDGFISNRIIIHKNNNNKNKKIIINPILSNNKKYNFPQIAISNRNNNNLSIIERNKQLEKIKSSLLRLKNNNNNNIFSFKHNIPNSFSDISIKKNKNIDNAIFKRSLSKENFVNFNNNDLNNNINKNYKIKILFQNNNLLNKRKDSKDYTNFLSI